MWWGSKLTLEFSRDGAASLQLFCPHVGCRAGLQFRARFPSLKEQFVAGSHCLRASWPNGATGSARFDKAPARLGIVKNVSFAVMRLAKTFWGALLSSPGKRVNSALSSAGVTVLRRSAVERKSQSQKTRKECRGGCHRNSCSSRNPTTGRCAAACCVQERFLRAERNMPLRAGREAKFASDAHCPSIESGEAAGTAGAVLSFPTPPTLRRESPGASRAREGINETVGSPYMQRLTDALVSMASAAISISTRRWREGSSREVGSGACVVAEMRCSLACALTAMPGQALREAGCNLTGRGSATRAL